ncbi:unnamed protein product [Rotaria sp. Silwood1]|nr:unnamed protein product [Rotaria sp. Silwood1]
MDYIGNHTWFSERYCQDDSGYGLDEIPDVGQRGEIVDLVRKFIDEYVRAPNFISAFDEEMLHIETLFNWNERIFEIKSPYRSGGNQIVVTSRIVGYQLHPLSSPSIMHYSLSERGLQIFGFQHLTFQEYFVAQFLVRESSIEEIAERIRLFTINPRFRESLLLALGWISWKWSLNNYDKFYNLLITPTKDYAIPFGTLLFFDAFNDLQKLPSKTVIFTALNSLLDHPSNLTAATYLIPNLSKLHEYIIIEWMQLHLKDEKRLLKFCQCLIRTMGRSSDENKIDSKSIPAVVYQQLWSLHYISTSAQFIIDQILRRIVSLDNFPNDVFTNELCSHVLSQNIFIDNIHPLILSVIIADIKVIVQLIDMFVANLYSYLCNKENSDYLADPMPNYVGIALQLPRRVSIEQRISSGGLIPFHKINSNLNNSKDKIL